MKHLSKAYTDPDLAPEVGRQNFDDVSDYNFIDNGARDCQRQRDRGTGAVSSAGQHRDPRVQLGVVPNATPASTSP